MMANEFYNINAECATLVPQGPAYANVSLENQVCSTVGSVPGSLTVAGSDYLSLAYNYSHSHLWRVRTPPHVNSYFLTIYDSQNFGIVCAFAVGFISVLLILTEFNQSLAGDTSVMLFKRGSKSDAVAAAEKEGVADEEKGRNETSRVGRAENGSATQGLAATAAGEVFSFQHLQYVVPVDKGTRKLLDDVSGYVRPGKLTALMGESGAGKTTLLNVLAERTTGGVVTGDRFMNGHPLPSDFQAHT